MIGDRQKQFAEQKNAGKSTNGADGARQDQVEMNDRSNDSDASLGNSGMLHSQSGHTQADDDFVEFLNITCPRSPLPAMDCDRTSNMTSGPNAGELPATGPLWFNSVQTQRPFNADCIAVAARSGSLHNDSRSGSGSQVSQPLTNSSSSTTNLESLEYPQLDGIFDNTAASKRDFHQHGLLSPSCEHGLDIRRDSATCCGGTEGIEQQRQHLDTQPERLSRHRVKVSDQISSMICSILIFSA